MTQNSHPNLQPNPFVSYRDPKTGLWVVVRNATVSHHSADLNSPESPGIQSREKKRANHLV